MIILFLHLAVILFIFWMIGRWPFGMQIVKAERNMLVNPKINNTNDFFACVFPNLVCFPVVVWTFAFSPLAWLFWKQFDEVGQNTQKDGTDLFFLATEIPTSRKRIFRRKVVFLMGFFLLSHLILFALPLSALLWKTGYFNGFTGLHTFLFLGWNFLITPLFLLVPLVILLFSLASLNSVWYTFLKWFGRFSVIFIGLLGFLIFSVLYCGGGVGEKIFEHGKKFFEWLGKNYLLATLTILGVVIGLAAFTLYLAYRDFQRKDLR